MPKLSMISMERPGAHTWEYWENALPYHVLFFSKVLKNNTY
jgi:S-formylglutathione hydrolase FrmB